MAKASPSKIFLTFLIIAINLLTLTVVVLSIKNNLLYSSNAAGSAYPKPAYPSCGNAPNTPVGQKRCVVVGEKSKDGTRCIYTKNGKEILMDCCLNNDKPQWTHRSMKCCASNRVVWRYNPNLPNERGTETFCESYCLDIDKNIPDVHDPVFGVCVKNGKN